MKRADSLLGCQVSNVFEGSKELLVCFTMNVHSVDGLSIIQVLVGWEKKATFDPSLVYVD